MSGTPDRPVRAPVAGGLAPERLERWHPLFVEGEKLFASRGLDLFVSRDEGDSFRPAGTVPVGPLERLLARGRISSRLLRAGFHDLVRLPGGELAGIVRGAIVLQSAGETRFRLVHSIERGSRPLKLAVAPSGRVYFGEYFSNPDRDEVHVYGSEDGRSFEVAYTFARGAIRHVHGIWPDPQRSGLWVLTGDEDSEAGIWWTDDDFRTLEPVVRGGQRARAVSVLCTSEGLIVPTDSPAEQNLVQRLDPATGHLEPLAEVPGSVFFAARTSSLFILSTVLEPSPVNRDPCVALVASADGAHWRVVARFRRDLRLLRDRRGFLLYPTLVLPGGTGTSSAILAGARSIAGLHGRLLRWSAGEVLGVLDAGEDPMEAAA